MEVHIPKSWRPEVLVDGKWSCNALRFRTKEEAELSAFSLLMRWTACDYCRATATEDEPNYEIVDNIERRIKD